MHHQKFLEEVGEAGVECERPRSQQLLGLQIFAKSFLHFLLILSICKQFVHLRDQSLKRTDLHEQTFWDQNAAIICVILSSLHDQVAKIIHDIAQVFIAILDFLRDNDHVWRSFKGTF